MTRRRRQTLSPTLFPFLAVLVCTLGTLILLLALVAQNTSDAAAQIAEAAAQEIEDKPRSLTVGQVQDLIGEEEFRLNELVSFRDAQTADLEDRRDQLAHLEDHTRRIRQRLQELGDAMRAAMEEQPELAVTEDELVALQERVEQEGETIRRLRDEVKTEKPRFVIVPHQGPNGTSRRPIYLECTDKGVMIWPEGIEITKWQLEHSSETANPLDDGLRAARYHALQAYGDQVPPYPMLLVRPDGVETYYAARAAMLQWDDQFGYELVPHDVELAYPNPDPAMREKIQYAVDEANKRVTAQSLQQRIAAAGPYGNAAGSGRVGSGAGRAGTAGPYASGRGAVSPSPGAAAGSQRSPRSMPPLSVSQMDREGRQSGFRDHRAYPQRFHSRGGYASSGSSLTAEDAKRRLERQMEDVAGNFEGVGTDPTLDDADVATVLSDQGESVQQTLSDPFSDGMTGGQYAGPTETQSLPPRSSETSIELTDPRGGSASSVDVAGNRLGNADEGGRVGQNFRDTADREVAMQDGSPTGQLGGAPVNPYARREVSQRYRHDERSGDATQRGTDGQPSAQNSSPQSPSNSGMVQRRGVDWALPSSVALSRGNEIVRYIRIEVHADRLVLPPSGTQRFAETVPIDADGLNQATLHMATLVRDRVESWGASAPGARWSPRLKVDVKPGGEQRFQQWIRLMAGSGLTIERAGSSQQAESASGRTLR